MNELESVIAQEERFALTLTQQDIYFDQLKNINSPLYNVGGYIRMGQLDVERLRQAHQTLVQGEATFGIRIQTGAQGIEQYISKDRTTQLPLVDFSQDADGQKSAENWLNQLFTTPLDIDNSELFKAALLKISTTTYWYVGFAHHLMMDGWGFANWAQRLGQIYNDSLEQKHHNGQSAIDWHNIAIKDQQYVQSKKYQADCDYWLQQTLATDRLLTPHYRTPAQGPTSSRAVFPLSNEQLEAVSALAQRHEVGVAHVFLALLASYFSTVYSQSNLVFGLPAHNRRNHQQKQMLGVFTSISPLTVEVDDEDCFVKLLGQVAQQQKNNFRHQRYPIGHMVKDLNLGGEEHGLYDICFNYLKLDSQLSFEGQAADLVYLSHNHETTPLMVTLWDYGEGGEQRGTEIQIDYNFSYFDEQDIDRLGARFNHHLEQLLANPEQPLKAAQIMPAGEMEELLYTVNDNSLDYPKSKFLDQLFTEQATKTPDNIALEFVSPEFGLQQLTYRQLDQRSSQLAHFLLEQGLCKAELAGEDKADILVGIAMARSVEMVISVLAVLKAGGAYVPLDPNYPQARLDTILTDSEVKLLLTDEALLSRFSDFPAIAAFSHHQADKWADYSTVQPQAHANRSSADLAYVIYTSGSTGRPKGVAVRHSNAMAMLHWAKANYTDEQLSRVLACTSINFDLSVFELFVPLCFGHQCVLVDNPLTLLQTPCQVSLINTVPSAINALIEQDAIPAGVKVINLAGEPLSAHTVNTLLEKGLCEKVCNLYGPSEDTTYSTCAQFVKPILGTPDIGRVISNSQAYVLSPKQQLLPVGIAGELYLAGDGVTRGYLNQDELTTKQFVANPFGEGKLYRTGDLVRYLPDEQGNPGAFAFLGRIDEQVKIRGFRIELGEIEHHLLTNDVVASCCVIAKKTKTGVEQLVAYVVLETGVELVDSEAIVELCDYLQPLLPEVMIPNAFVFLDIMPLTPNGKVDKKALPEPEQLNSQSQYVAPTTETERQLVSIYAELLQLSAKRLSTTASFFTLGGNSLLVVQLMAAIRSQMKLELAISEIFSSPTIRELARSIDAGSSAVIRTEVTAIERVAGEPIAASFAQQRLWFIDQLHGSSAEYNMPAALAVEGDFDIAAAELALTRIIERHEPLRTVFKSGESGSTEQLIKAKFTFTISRQDLSELEQTSRQEKINALIKEQSAKPFELTQDLMLRASYLDCGTGQTAGVNGVLLLTMHHIASDGWSVDLLLNEFAIEYQSVLESTPSPLAPLAISYADYAHWQQQWLVGAVLAHQLDYWRAQLDQAPWVHSLVLDYPRPKAKALQGEIVKRRLDSELSERLGQVAKSHQLTPFMLLHGALALVLSRHSNSDDIVIGTPVANRLQAELEPLIGLFVNTLVLRTDTSHDDLSDYLAHIRTVNIDAQSHQDIPFEQLVEHLNVPRSAQHTPIFQIVFSMDAGLDLDKIAIPGLSFTQLNGAQEVAKFDLDIRAQISEQGIEISWIYDTSLFTHSHIESLSEHLNYLLTAIAKLSANPLAEQPLSELPMLSSTEQHQLIHQLNDVDDDYPQDKSIHQIFEMQAAQTPDNIALMFGSLESDSPQLSYEALNQASNQLAHYLRSQGVGAEMLVGICVERSVDMIVAMLAILKAGGAYVPLDPNYPQSRLQYIVEDSNLQHLLTHGQIAAKFSFASQLQSIELDSPALIEHLAGLSKSNLQAVEQPDSSALANVIYTSGTTGQPKGVLLPHVGVVRLVKNPSFMVLDQTTRFIHSSSFSFDAATLEIWGPLLNGGSCILYGQQQLDLDWLNQTITKYQANTLFLTAGLFEQWSYVAQNMASLRWIGTGGDVVDPAAVKRVKEALSQVQIVCAYGPTEGSVISTSHLASDSVVNGDLTSIPIGRPIRGASVYVLSAKQQLVPLHAVGELYIGGASLARGYLNKPELTTQKFIQNPFSDDPQARLYRSGDLVRYLPNTQCDEKGYDLQFIGRTDDQVKISGFRIELGEIESQLLQCDYVESALVLAKEANSGQKQIVAYVVQQVNDGAKPALAQSEFIAQLRESLHSRLPSYMMPSAFVNIDQWPLTSNGKIDKKALPSVDASLQEQYIPASTDTERKLVKIFSELLELPADTLGVTANFFELGGHSLLAIRLVAVIAAQMNVKATVKVVFENPTIAMLSKALEQLTSATNYPAIVAIERDNENGQGFISSFAQQRLWLLNQIDGPSAHYNISGALKLSGRINMAALNGAFTALIERHESLRTVFKANPVDGEPMQLIKPVSPVVVPVVDLSALTDEQQQHRLAQTEDQHRNYIFDLANDSMLQLKLVKLSDIDSKAQHVLLFNTHHIASDGWSMDILSSEFGALYGALDKGLEIPLAPLPVQYVDYAKWQRDYLQGEVLQQNLDYWTEQLAQLPISHNLPLNGPRPVEQTFNGASFVSRFDNTLAESLQAMCQDAGATLFMGLHAAFSVLLARYSNETDIVIGTPVANREQAEVAGLIGFFVNTLVLRSDLSAEPSFKQLLEQSKQTLLGAYEHQQLPFEQLVETLQPERSLSHSPLFQVMLVLKNEPTQMLSLPDLKAAPHQSALTVTKYDLTLSVSVEPNGLALDWQYNSDLFNESLIAQMAKHFERLVSAMATASQSDTEQHSAQQSVFELPMLAEDEIHRQVVQWQGPSVDYPAEQCVHQLFERQAAQHPDAIALSFEQHQLTYAKLNARANQLAALLIKQRQVGVGSIVGICVERSFDMLIAILAVHKAGGAYVPLDPSYPKARLEYIVNDAGLNTQAGTILTQAHLVEQMPLKDDCLVILDDNQQQIALADYSPDNTEVAELTPQNLAYLMYTSGSTGLPKGVAVYHQGLTNYVSYAASQYCVEVVDSVVSSSLSFDATVTTLLTPLTIGGCVELLSNSENDSLVLEHLHTALDSTSPKLFKLTPAHLSGIQGLIKTAIDTPHVLVIGGEALLRSVLQGCQRLLPGSMFINEYGPTETVVGCCIHTLAPFTNDEGAKEDAPIPIGRAIQNSQLYVVNHAGQLQPEQVSGELWIGGDGVAQGYWQAEELTASQFIANPFVDDPQARVYRSGDLVRYLENGELQFIGRSDHQVKIRGFRIELGEIEHHLAGHEAISSSLVIANESEQQLIAYLVPEVESAVPETDLVSLLRLHLQQELPEYMVPSAFVVLSQWPLTTNGKIDKNALPSAEYRLVQGEYVAASTDAEQQLVELWSMLLKLPADTLSVTANFFELGGHSLLAVRLKSAIAEQLNIEVTVKTIFANPTIATLAAVLESASTGLNRKAIQPIERDSVGEQELVTSFAQQQLWLLAQIDGSSVNYNMPGALKLSGRLNMAALNGAFSAVIERHESLRTVFAANSVNDEPVQLIQPASAVAVTVSDLSNLAFDEQQTRLEQMSAEHAAYPFDLSSDLMLQLKLVKLQDSEHVLLFNMHHIASDGWSIGILINEFCALYTAIDQGVKSPLQSVLPPLPIQYADYAKWQRDTLQGELLQSELDYWRNQLADLPLVHSLPLAGARPPVQSFNGATHISRFDTHLSEQLNEVCRLSGASLFMGLHGAFSVLLARYSNETDIAIGTAVANREQSEVAGLIGFFVNTLVLRSDFSEFGCGENPTFSKVLEHSKQTLLDAYEHQQLPFELLVETLQPERNLSYSPLVQVMLVLQNNEKAAMSLPDLSLTPLETATAKTNFDLTLTVSEDEQGLSLEWRYNSDLFTDSMIETMAGHFKRLVSGLVDVPASVMNQQGAFTVPMLAEDEWQQQLVQRPDYHCDYPTDKCISQLFEQQVENSPNAVAVVFEQQSLTYAQLDAQANQLAHCLIEQHQVSADSLVGICVERSVEMIVGILAILKAGGAYVPLDPSYPKSRIDYILDDAQIGVVLTQQQVLTKVDLANCQTICIDTDRVTNYPKTSPVLTINSHSLAYIIYTSGSTGQPKGVMVTHQNVRRLFDAADADFNFNSSDVWTLFHSFAFDFSVWEIWGPLLYGGRLVVVPYDTTRNTSDFYQLVKQQKVTVLNQTPSAFNLFIDADKHQSEEQSTALSLRYVIFGGEALNLAALGPWVEKHGDNKPKLINMYGITETTVHVTYRQIKTIDIEQSGHVSLIGRPLADLSVMVLSPTLMPVPLGVAGELHVSGGGLALGYLNREDLTEQRFIESPFSDSKERLYKSGDLVRWLRGTDDQPVQLEYLGRIDQQVKIRGFRIELDEIASHVVASRLVASSTVVVRDDTPSDPQIVVYWVPDSESSVDDNQIEQLLREYLSERIPAYMHPAAYVMMEALPLTANGKIDRKALPQPQMSIEGEHYQSAKTDIERRLVEVWADVLMLDQEQISTTANFFVLGGHSLASVRLMSRIREVMAVELAAKDVFAAPTIVQLAQLVESKLGDELRSKVTVVERESPLLLSYAQQRIWFIDRLNGGSTEYNIPVAFEVNGTIELPVAEQAIARIIERHEPLRTIYSDRAFGDKELSETELNENDSGPEQIVLQSFDFAIKQHDLRELTEQALQPTLETLVKEHSELVFDLSADLMIDVAYIHLPALNGQQRGVLLFNMHHIASDGWSMHLLVSEFMTQYQACLAGQDSPLPPLEIEYVDYSYWQRQWLTGPVVEQQLQYWQQQLADVAPVHSLPLCKSRPAQKQYNGNMVVNQLPAQVGSALVKLAGAHNLSTFMLAHCALGLVLARHSNQSDIVVGTPVANRLQAELEPLIGCFINTLVLRIQTSQPTLGDLFEHVKQVNLDAQSHQDVPFEFLLERLNVVNSIAHTPLFQIMLTTDNDYGLGRGSDAEDLSMPGVEFKTMVSEQIMLKFDLKVNVSIEQSGVNISSIYDTSLFSGEFIQTINEHLGNVLTAMAQMSADTELTRLPMLGEQEQKLLCHSYNDTDVDYPVEQCMHQLFMHQVLQQGQSRALSDEHGTMSYEQLFADSYQVYLTLRECNVGLEELVAVRAPKGRWQLVATLGVMMAGGAYLPLETKWPMQRCQGVCEQANCRYVLTIDNKFAIDGVETLLLPQLVAQGQPHTDVAGLISEYQSIAQPQHLAYVIFTSGSTGKPKGVAIEHRSAVNTLLDINSQYQVDKSDKVLAVSALSFDLSVYDLFGLLAAGGEVVFPHDELAMDPRHWLEMIEQHQVTIWDTVPASAGLLVEQLELQNRQSSAPLANVMMSGDWIDPGLPQRLKQVFTNADIYSLGGATEGSIWSIHYPIKTDTSGLKSVPYGKPLSNQRFYIVDNQLNLSPLGAVGELCIGGIGVARGYYGAPELTEKQFIYHQGLEQKLYRTGDLGRYMPDGNIEFMGRLDHQVKIRGFRIEIGEIEQNLKNCDNVGSALVVAKKDDLDNQYLVAYVLPEDKQLISADEEYGAQLKVALKAHLLDYMIPDYFIVMERWPLTANGKVDVKSLPLPDFTANQSEYIAPRTDTEKTLVGIWAQLLEQEEATIGISSNFADIGGHSILIVRMVMLIQEAFDVKLAIRDIYIQNTIELLGVLIDERLSSDLVEQQKAELNKQMAQKLENLNEDDDVEEFSL